MLHYLDHLLAQYGYGLVAAIIALEAMGLPLPGESLLIAGAVYCATTHKLSIVWMLAAALAGAIMGDNIGYAIGRSAGYRMLARYGRKVGISEDRLLLGRHLFRRYGASVVFIGRFVAVLRTFAALLAGANRMPWLRFLFWNGLGGAVWVGGYGIAAYVAGDQIRHIEGPAGIAMAIVVAALAIVSVVFLKRNESRLTEMARREAGLARRSA